MAYNPTDHPRAPKGTPQGGQFTQKAGVGVDDDLTQASADSITDQQLIAAINKPFIAVQERFQYRVNRFAERNGVDVDAVLTFDYWPIKQMRKEEYAQAANEAARNLFEGAFGLRDKIVISGKVDTVDVHELDPSDIYYTHNYNPLNDPYSMNIGLAIELHQWDGGTIRFLPDSDGVCRHIHVTSKNGDITTVPVETTLATMRTHAGRLLHQLSHNSRTIPFEEDIKEWEQLLPPVHPNDHLDE